MNRFSVGRNRAKRRLVLIFYARTHNARSHEQNARNSRGLRGTGKSLRIALAGAALIGALAGTAGAQAPTGGLTPAAAGFAQNAPTSQPTPNNQGFFLTRLFDLYVDEFNPPPPAPAEQTAAAPTGRRPAPFPPAPLDAPPWPWTDWPSGGTPLLGGATPNSSGNNLMKALHGTSTGDFLNDNNIEIWGWVDSGFNVSTSSGKNGNAPAGYDFQANQFQLSQAVVYIERIPDTVQQDHIDWGFRVVGLYGTDYREVTMQGLFSDQLTKHNALYGYTPANFYLDLYIPWIGQGTDIRVGRYTTLGDIEADLDYQNVFDTHSLYYTYDPFTQFGLVWSTRLSKNWMVQLGVNAGSDVAPWESDAKPTVTGCVQWTSDSSWDNAYLCANGTNDARYGFNNVNLYQFMYYHKITNRLWAATEDYYEYQTHVPTVSTIPKLISKIPPQIPGANPAFCSPSATETSCTAGVYATSLYLMYQLTEKDYVGIRSEAFDDVRGQRTGFKTWYTESTLGWVHWLSPSIEVRPEIRYDHSFAAAAYDNGTKHSQFAFATDLLIKF
jgi:putative OmpL-like beta-barrel porin-2